MENKNKESEKEKKTDTWYKRIIIAVIIGVVLIPFRKYIPDLLPSMKPSVKIEYKSSPESYGYIDVNLKQFTDQTFQMEVEVESTPDQVQNAANHYKGTWEETKNHYQFRFHDSAPLLEMDESVQFENIIFIDSVTFSIPKQVNHFVLWGTKLIVQNNK